MTPHLVYGRCGGDSHKPSKAKADQDREADEHDEGHNGEEGNSQNHHSNEREDPAITVPLVTSQKWSDSQARRTSDAQSEVFDTGTKKPGGEIKIGSDALNKQLQQIQMRRKAMTEERARARTTRAPSAGCRGTRPSLPSVRKARRVFMRENTPSADDIVRKIRGKHTKSNRRRRRDPVVRACIKEQRQNHRKAIEVVNELIKI